MPSRTKIVLKISGTFAADQHDNLSSHKIAELAQQILSIRKTYQILLVIGGGNIIRGAQQFDRLQVSAASAHQMGMLATLLNGTLVTAIFTHAGIATTHLSAIACPDIADKINSNTIAKAAHSDVIVASGGTGNPFFSTDTAAVVRALEFGATTIFKGTNVDGIYTADPHKNATARLLAHTTFNHAITASLNVMDQAAFILAGQHNLTVRIFNIFTPNAFIRALAESTFGSTITQQENV